VSFASAIDLAGREGVDLVLITGDLFDHARVGDDVLEWTATQLDRLHCPVVLLVGNHDALHDASVHHRFEVTTRCRQVQILDDPDGSVVRVPDAEIVVWGRAMVEHEPAFRPLQGVPARDDDAWCIVAGHGLWVGSEAETFRSSPIYPSDLDAIDWDYIALGHHHLHAIIRTEPVPVCFAGATASSFQSKPGAVIVDFKPGQTAALRWMDLSA
jgi:DNA repair exonuclease SbcCD nuclease subunit